MKAVFTGLYCSFLHARYTENVDQGVADVWSIESPVHAKQPDSLSCGVYVLKLAERFLNGRNLQFNLTQEELIQTRKSISACLLYAAEQAIDPTESETSTPPTKDVVTSTVSPSDTPDLQPQCNESIPVEIECSSNAEDTCTMPTEINDRSSGNESIKRTETGNKSMDVDEKGYILRAERKMRKKSSFVYIPYKKKTRKSYCICHLKKDDGRLFWFCEVCENWFHPSCIGMSEADEPEHFVCSSCKVTEHSKHSDGRPIKIAIDTINTSYQSLLTEVQVMINCEDSNCEAINHRRHHSFISTPVAVYNSERKKYCFGLHYFGQNVTEELLSKLITDLLVYKRDEKFPVTGMKSQSLRGLNENTALFKVFQEFKTFGSSYIMFIVLKEILIKVACDVTDETYTTVEENCLRTEVNINQIAKTAMKNK